MSAMHQDESPDLKVVASKLKDILEISSTSLEMRKVIVELCDIVATRGARLSAAGILALHEVQHLHGEYPQGIVGEEVAGNILIEHSNDGSGIGAAFLAASHSQYLGVEES
ncbi:hypothetical protein TIFTF001_019800 [Ficus carica]|uniref:Phosphotransferase n=1 Tax=Ficus carica TaxID=3494 RepID=A0AA88AQX3_FICCA|nr:hypothetical protein TIFTF001_019800 [Ficus carica]